MRVSYRLISSLARIVSRLVFGLSIRGLENVPRQGKLLIAANHQSYWDPPLMGGSVPREIYYMAKAELFRFPLFGGLIRHLNAFPINRSGQDMESVRRALAVLDGGGALLVFPEGTRSRTGTFLKTTRGLGLLAKQSGASVIPTYIHGTRGCWRRPFRAGPLEVIFGEPLQFSSMDVKQLNSSDAYRDFSELIMQKIAALQAATIRS